MTELPHHLISDLRAGKEDAYQTLYELYGDQVYMLSLGILQNEADAQDVVQKTFFHVYRKLYTLKNDKCFLKWLMKIASNEALMTLRQRKPVESYGDQPDDIRSDILQDDTVLPENAAEQSEEADRLRAIIARLPEAQRRTLTLYYYHEMKISEIAEIMECSEGTVKSRLRYARLRVKDEWEKQEGERKHYGVMLPFGEVFVRLIKQKEPQKRRKTALWKRIRARLGTVDDLYMRSGRSNKTAAARIGAYAAVGVAVVMLASATIAGVAEDVEEPSGGFGGGSSEKSRIAETQPEETLYYADEDIVANRMDTGAGNDGDYLYRYEQYFPPVEQEIPDIPEEIGAIPPTEQPTELSTEPPTESPTESPTQAPAEAPTQFPLEKMLTVMSGRYRMQGESEDIEIAGGTLTLNQNTYGGMIGPFRFASVEDDDGIYAFRLEKPSDFDGFFDTWSGYMLPRGTAASRLPVSLQREMREGGYINYGVVYTDGAYRLQKDAIVFRSFAWDGEDYYTYGTRLD